MTIEEFFALGKRRCRCDDVTLSVLKEEIPKVRLWSHDPLKHLMKCSTHGVRYLKPRITWNGRCSKCNKLYLVSDTKTALLKSISDSKLTVYGESQ